MIYRKIVKKSRLRTGKKGRKGKTLAGKTIKKIKQQLKKLIRTFKAAYKKNLTKIKRWLKKQIRKIKSRAGKINTKIKRRLNKNIKIGKAAAGKIITGIKTWHDNLAKTAKNREAKKTDSFLIISLIALSLGFLIINLAFNRSRPPEWTEIQLSRQWKTAIDSETLNELIMEFEESNPGLRITLAGDTSFADNGTRNPDIVFLDDSLLGNLIKQKALLPLNSFTENPDNAGQWAIPVILSMDLLFYNIDLLKSAGFDRPPKTRDEFLKFARAVQAGPGQAYGTAPGLSLEDPHAVRRDIFSWYWAAGYSVIKDGKPRLDKKALEDLAYFLWQISQTGLPGENPFDKTGTSRLQEFAQGRLAMIVAPAQAISFLRQQPVNFDFGITVIPGTTAPEKNSLGLSGLYAGIPDTCTHPDEAWLFLSFLEQKSPVIAAKAKAVPGLLHGLLPAAKGFPGDYLNDDPLYAKAWAIFESSDIADTLSAYTQANELEQAVLEELRNYFNGNVRPTDTADAILKRWEAIVEQD